MDLTSDSQILVTLETWREGLFFLMEGFSELPHLCFLAAHRSALGGHFRPSSSTLASCHVLGTCLEPLLFWGFGSGLGPPWLLWGCRGPHRLHPVSNLSTSLWSQPTMREAHGVFQDGILAPWRSRPPFAKILQVLSTVLGSRQGVFCLTENS